MIDPRFANAGAVPFVPGYGAQQGPQYYHHHRHHRHHKHKNRNDDSPISRDESIHKVDHSQPHHFHQQEGAQYGGGFGVPYGGANYGYANQYQGQFAGGPTVKHHRHNRHHRHHVTEGGEGFAQAYAVPEQLIGQRSSSVLGKDHQHVHSSVGDGGGDAGHYRHHRHHRRNYRHPSGGEYGHGHIHHSHSHHSHHRTYAAADGYGHINDELIFIERGDHSPHRQQPPPGYEYRGKIEVQNFEKEQHSQTFVPAPVPAPPPPQPTGPCPPGWQPMVLTAGGHSEPCPPGGLPYTGQFVGSASAGQIGVGGFSSGPFPPLPPNCQIIADYIVGANTGGGGYQQTTNTGYTGQNQFEESEGYTTTRPTIIEVWQKRAKSEPRERSRSRSRQRTRTPGPDFDFDKFRAEILAAIERILARAPAETHGTQTHPGETRIIETRQEAGEVRVIVQPIQPVFYMPRQTDAPAPQIVTVPAPQPAPSAPNVVYVPRNVYVPVIKPVFVPRERVIVRPQVIHVARPVLVDRPVPVTQRPIIIDRERPIPVPVRAPAAQGGGSKIVREEYVYRDNLPVAYGGRCAEFAGGVNYGYVPTQQAQQYASSSVQEASSVYQAGGAATVEILDAAVNPNWQKTDQTSLVRRYGRPAVEIVHQSKEVEQQMYNELRQRSSSGVDIRSASVASYGSGSGIGVGDGCIGPF